MSRTPGAKDRKPRKKREDENRPAWSNSPSYIEAQTPIQMEYNSRRIAFQREIFPVGDLPKDDPQELLKVLSERFSHYLEMCDKYGMKIGNQAAYFAMGLNKERVWDWINVNHTNPAVKDFLKKVQHFCATYREGMMEDGKINPVVGIFWAKNYDGLRDQQELVVAQNNPLGDKLDAASLEQKYLEMTETPLLEADSSKNSQKGLKDILGVQGDLVE